MSKAFPATCYLDRNSNYLLICIRRLVSTRNDSTET